MPQVWQVGSGDAGREYSDLFLKHDVMFIGPGRFGPYNRTEYEKQVAAGAITAIKKGMVDRFHGETQTGDLVLLRHARDVIALGVVAEEGCTWNEAFDDVHGWDLQHTRRVIWQDRLKSELAKTQQTSGLFYHLKRATTYTKVFDNKVLGRIEHLFDKCKLRALKNLPEIPAPLAAEEFGQQLFSKGVANDAVDKVLLAIKHQRRLLHWYRNDGKESHRLDEHEVVAHMILPLLLALGWSEQLLAVEWHRVDLAGFWSTPTTKKHCVLACEAKRLGAGLQNKVLKQAIGYVRKLKLQGCRKILLTDGGRFYLYQRMSKEWGRDPVGFVNVEKIRTRHILPANTNAVDTIVALSPSNVARELA